MTEITFHFNVPDRLNYSCRLLRKTFAKGAFVAVTGDASMLAELDSRLWSLASQEFVPHCVQNAPAQTLEMSPIVLTEFVNLLDRNDVLVNLGRQVPVSFERFERLIEVVIDDEDDRLAARQRWRHYAGRGYVLRKHEFTSVST